MSNDILIYTEDIYFLKKVDFSGETRIKPCRKI